LRKPKPISLRQYSPGDPAKSTARTSSASTCNNAVEKYMEGRLVEASASFPKTHDLEQLLDLVVPLEPLWDTFRPSMAILSNAAVLLRYPGHTISAADATKLYKAVVRMRELMRDSLGM